MLAEFDPYTWDKWIFIGGSIVMVAIYFLRKRWMEAKVST